MLIGVRPVKFVAKELDKIFEEPLYKSVGSGARKLTNNYDYQEMRLG